MPLPDLRRRSTSTIEALGSRESDFQTASAGLLAAVVERTRDGGDLEVVAATGAVVQGAVGAGEGRYEERADRVGRHGNDGNEGLSDRMGSRIAFPTPFPEREPLAGGRGKP